MVELIKEGWHFITHLNETLPAFVAAHGSLIYVLLFCIIFVETGLIVMPFLPGDSLLFAAGALCAQTSGDPNATLQILPMIALLSFAAILGDNVNYGIGRFFGARVVKWKIGKRQLVKQAHIDKTHGFFEKYGTKAIIMARFVPIVRTFTPFVAGVGGMAYRKKFLPYDVFGGILWISSMSLAGYLLGQNEWIKGHFEAVVLIIIGISLLPMVIGFLRHKMQKKKAA
jgi:membrane-associated protein